MRHLKVIEVYFLQNYTYFSIQLFQPCTTFFKEHLQAYIPQFKGSLFLFIWKKKNVCDRKEHDIARKDKCLWTIFLQFSNLVKHLSFIGMLQATYWTSINALHLHGAAKASCSCILHTVKSRWTSYNANRCEYQACPRLACGRCGGARRGQGTHEQQGMAASLFPPQNIKAAIDRASTFCLCERKKHWPVFRWPLLFSRPSCNKRDRHGRQCEK